MSQAEWVAAVGVGLLLAAFVANLAGWLRRDSRAYQLANAAGAALACYASVLLAFAPFVVLEAVWCAAAVAALLAGPRPGPSAPAAPRRG